MIQNINYYLNTKANPYILAIYRISFGLLSFLIVLRSFEYFDLLWYNITSSETILLLKSLLTIWGVVSLLIVVGLGGVFLE